VDRRASLPIQPALLGEYAPDPLPRTQSGHPVLTRTDTAGRQLVGDESVAESRFVGMDIESSVDQVRVDPITLRDGASFPSVEWLDSND
jgi:hypothetical protein